MRWRSYVRLGQIAYHAKEGKTRREIADEIGVTVPLVEYYCRRYSIRIKRERRSRKVRRVPLRNYRTKSWFFRERENLVHEVRLEMDLTQQDLARRVGKPCSTISTLEMGYVSPFYIHGPRQGKLKGWVQKVCEVLEAEPSYLFPRDVCEIERRDLTDEQRAWIVHAEYREPVLEMERREQERLARGWIENELPEQERTVAELRFGLRDGEEWTLDAVGELIGTCKERVRQVEAKVLRKLRWRFEHVNEIQRLVPMPVWLPVVPPPEKKIRGFRKCDEEDLPDFELETCARVNGYLPTISTERYTSMGGCKMHVFPPGELPPLKLPRKVREDLAQRYRTYRPNVKVRRRKKRPSLSSFQR